MRKTSSSPTPLSLLAFWPSGGGGGPEGAAARPTSATPRAGAAIVAPLTQGNAGPPGPPRMAARPVPHAFPTRCGLEGRSFESVGRPKCTRPRPRLRASSALSAPRGPRAGRADRHGPGAGRYDAPQGPAGAKVGVARPCGPRKGLGRYAGAKRPLRVRRLRAAQSLAARCPGSYGPPYDSGAVCPGGSGRGRHLRGGLGPQ